MMTARIKFLIFLSIACLSLGCDEVPVELNPGGNAGGGSVPVEEQPRQVLIEEFTGVRCVNCPAASEAIQALLGIHGSQLVAVSIHAGFFSPPYSDSRDTLVTPTGSAILDLVGAPTGFPTAVVNRAKFSGEENRQVGQGTWAGYIAEELQKPPRIRIDLGTNYNNTTRELEVEATLYPTENITEPDVRFTAYFFENNVIDKQLTPEGLKDDYVHKLVFRAALSPFDGDRVTETLTANVPVRRTYTYTVPADYKVEDSHIIGFVSLGGSNLQVLQAHQVSIVD